MNIKRLGIGLIIGGLVLLTISGYTYIKHRSDLDSGMIIQQTERSHSLRWKPVTGVFLLIGGILITGRDFKVHT